MANNYIPQVVKIERVVRETPDVNTFYLRLPLDFTPGQFVEVSCFGKGEVPISIASSPQEELLRLSFKRMGSVTGGLFDFKTNDAVGIRGPFGNGFPLLQLEDTSLIFIAGGIGIAPLRSLLKTMLLKDVGNNITLLYGARSPEDMLYKNELTTLTKNTKVLLTVDKPNAQWKGRVGVVPQLLGGIKFDPLKTKAFICGPEIMMRFTTARLIELGMPPANIILSLERYMKCGLGKCGHCYIADKFVCRDGPVFTYEQLNRLVPEEIL